MKKAYISPKLDAIKLLTPALLDNTSIPNVDDEPVDEQHSNKYQGGFLWEDDNNVTE